ncbi:MAG TPA: hypothetical protein VHE09_13685, partial [Rhizomicrobium sp.]|nr:hypothetical protein [Rhizomicrobium sp.]
RRLPATRGSFILQIVEKRTVEYGAIAESLWEMECEGWNPRAPQPFSLHRTVRNGRIGFSGVRRD